MLKLPPDIIRLAEDIHGYAPLRRGDTRLQTDRYVITMSGTPGPHDTVVQRLRLEDSDVAEVVAEVRMVLRKEGRRNVTWEIGPSASPSDLPERLQALGMKPFFVPTTVSMVHSATALPIQPAASGVRVIRVTTREDFRLAQEISWKCFDYLPEGDVQAAVEKDFFIFQKSPRWLRYLALFGDRAVASADAAVADEALILCGAATLPESRGQGVYRALLAARAQEAVRRSIPYLVTQAGPMSRPILARLGFSEVARVQIFVDPQL